MEIIYPDAFIKFYNDEEIDDVGEFEIYNSNIDFDSINAQFNGYRFKPQLPDFRPPFVPPGPPPFPGGGGGTPGGGGFPGGGSSGSQPPGPPPSQLPSKNDQNVKSLSGTGGGPQVKAVSPEAISFCRYKYTYIWQTNGRAYWAYLTRVDRVSVSGFRWAGWQWVYFGLDVKKIDSFVCY